MKIVLDARTATNHFPGIGRYVFNLARAIIPQLNSNEHLILLHHPAQPSPFNLNALFGPQAQVIDVPVSPFTLKQQWIIPRLLPQLKADVYHSPYYLMPYRLPVPTVLTIYDLIPLRYPHYFSLSTRLIFRWATALAVRTSAAITTISHATRRDLLTYYHPDPAKVTTIHLAADPNFCPQHPEIVAALRARLNLPEQYILYVGSNKPHKNLVRLIEAWDLAKHKSKIVNHKLVIAGVWDARYPQAKERAIVLGLSDSVQFTGPVAEADLPALYSGAVAFIFPSEYEGFGLPVLEAMACGTPVACANVSSLPEIVGEGAVLFEPTQVMSIANTLQQVLTDTDLLVTLRHQSLRQSARFSWTQTAQQTLELFRQVMAVSA